MRQEEKALAEKVSDWLGYLSDDRIEHINAIPKALSRAKKYVTTIDVSNRTVTFCLRYAIFSKGDSEKDFSRMTFAARSLLAQDWKVVFTDRWSRELAVFDPQPVLTSDSNLVGYNPKAKVIVTHEGKPVNSLTNVPAAPKGA